MWYLFENGLTIDIEGSEKGFIIKDEEHSEGARITLEKEIDHGIPFAITCGIYGLLVHTVYCSNIDKSIKMYESIKHDIEKLLLELNDDNMTELVEEFINKY